MLLQEISSFQKHLNSQFLKFCAILPKVLTEVVFQEMQKIW